MAFERTIIEIDGERYAIGCRPAVFRSRPEWYVARLGGADGQADRYLSTSGTWENSCMRRERPIGWHESRESALAALAKATGTKEARNG